ncbi:MAG: transcriptional regulator [Candidatus Methanomethylophilaceae archaeon]|jgi:putative transcriptional regulator
MGREDLIATTRDLLARAGYVVSSPLNLRSICFDIVARKDDNLLIIKVLSNIDAFSKENAEEMKILSDALSASALLIGERSSSGALEEGIIYSRFDVPIISNETLMSYILEEEAPAIYAAPGGLYVKLDGELLREIRERSGISLGVLAETAGVSRRTIQMYESGMGAMIDAALRIEEFFDMPIIMPLNPFGYRTGSSVGKHELSGDVRTGSEVMNKLMEIGFSITPLAKSPFDALSRVDDVLILTGAGSNDEKLMQRALIASEISDLVGRLSVVIVDSEPARENINKTAVVSNKELKKMDESGTLTDLVLSRSTKR